MRVPYLLAFLLAAPAFAEGAVQVFDCDTKAICDEVGRCAPLGEALTHRMEFRIEPVSVGPQGEGDYRITYNDVSVPMRNVTGLGPLLWSEGHDDVQSILLTGESSLLWHSLDGTTGRSVISFFTCKVTQ